MRGVARHTQGAPPLAPAPPLRRRLVVAVGVTAALALFAPRAAAAGGPALLALAGAWAYAMLLTFTMRREAPRSVLRFVALPADVLVAGALVWTTGGLDSPFDAAWLGLAASAAVRYGVAEAFVAGAVYAAAHAGIGLARAELPAATSDLLVAVSFILVVAAVSAGVARQALERRLHAEALERRIAEARTAEAKFRGLLESAPDGVIICDARGRVVLVNGQTERMFGYTREELLGARIETLLPESIRARHVGHRTDFMENPHTRPMGKGLDLRGQRKDGSEFPVEVSLSPLQSEEGLLITSVVRDVTDRRKAEAERVASLARLEELERLKEVDRFKTAFINTAAHELGTPLTPIKVQLHLLKRQAGALPERERNALSILDRNVDRMGRLVADILEGARIQAGRLAVKKEKTDMVPLIREAVASFEEAARQGGVTLAMRAEGAMPVSADPQRVMQVLFNLISNALKFTPRDGRVTVEARLAGDEAVVAVRDTGIGIAPEDVKRLFQPFSQVHDTMQKTRAGTGLGLYISRGIVELHGGRLWCESGGKGKGTSFVFTVPCQDVEARVSEPRRAVPTSAPAPKPRVDPVAERAKELV